MANPPSNTWQWINAIATWLSAIGTVATAALALWLSVRDRRVSVISRLSLGLVPSHDPNILNQSVFVIEFTNNGPRTITITNHTWRLPFSRTRLMLFPNIGTSISHLCSQLPLELTDGKSGHIFYKIDHFLKLDKPEKIFFHPNSRIAWLRIWFFRLHLSTSIGKKVHVKVDRGVRSTLWKQYNSA